MAHHRRVFHLRIVDDGGEYLLCVFLICCLLGSSAQLLADVLFELGERLEVASHAGQVVVQIRERRVVYLLDLRGELGLLALQVFLRDALR